MGLFWFFLAIGIILGFLQAFFGDVIYEFHSDPDEKNREQLQKKMEIIKNAPRVWKIERFIHRFLGVLIGWLMLWMLLDKRINLFSGSPNSSNIGAPDLILFLFGWIGINGRLPTIAHAVQDWFRR